MHAESNNKNNKDDPISLAFNSPDNYKKKFKKMSVYENCVCINGIPCGVRTRLDLSI
jgi:hypothetical protein